MGPSLVPAVCQIRERRYKVSSMSTSSAVGMNAPLDWVEAPMNYLVDSGEKPVSYTYEPPPGVPARTGKVEKQTITIINGRPVADQITLDNQGFMLTHHR